MGNTQAKPDAKAAELARKRHLQKLKTAGCRQNDQRNEDSPSISSSHSQSIPADAALGSSRSSADTPMYCSRQGKRCIHHDPQDAMHKRMRTSQEVDTPQPSLLVVLRLTGKKAPAPNNREATSFDGERAASTPVSGRTPSSVSGVRPAAPRLSSAVGSEPGHKDGTVDSPPNTQHEETRTSSSTSPHQRVEQIDGERHHDTLRRQPSEGSQKSGRPDKGYHDYLRQSELLETSRQAADDEPSTIQVDNPRSEPGVSKLPLRQPSSPDASHTDEANLTSIIDLQSPGSGNAGQNVPAEAQEVSQGPNAPDSKQQELNKPTPSPAAPATAATNPEDDPLTEIWLSLYLPDNETKEVNNCVPLTATDTRESLFQAVEADLEGQYDAQTHHIFAVHVRRADGQKIQGCPHSSMPIMRSGRGGTWEQIVRKLLKNGGAGEDGLHAHVKLRQVPNVSS